MEKKNLVEILKNCPKGMELDCTMFEDVKFSHIDSGIYPIVILTGGSEETLTEHGHWDIKSTSKCVIFPKGKTTWEGFVPPVDFKDGDIVYTRCDGNEYIFIFKNTTKNTRGNSYLHLKGDDLRIMKVWMTNCNDKYLRFATEEEKQKLFQAIKDNGYKWNPETKTLEKLIEPKFKVGDRIKAKELNLGINTITKVCEDHYILDDGCTVKLDYQEKWGLVSNKFDITTLKPFDKVLVRDQDDHKWKIELFSSFANDDYCWVVCLHSSYNQCIPYEGNEHLLGTTDDCDEYYKTWEL